MGTIFKILWLLKWRRLKKDIIKQLKSEAVAKKYIKEGVTEDDLKNIMMKIYQLN